jgi:thymidylate kinase
MRQIDLEKEFSLTAKSRTGSSVSPVLLAVLHDFHRKKISYCCWKSSRNVRSVLTGEGDLDLLIAREDQHRCEIILLERGLKLLPPVPSRDHPALLSFLGYDDLTGRLVHIHLHFRLVAGERLLKNYILPWEDVVLARAIQHPELPLKILDPASEALLLIIRGCLELRRRDPVTLRHWAATTHKFAMDRKKLAAHVHRGALYDLATELMDEDLARNVVGALYGEKPLEDQRSLRRHVEKYLAPYRTYNTVEVRLRMIGRAVLWTAGHLNKFFHLPRPWSRRAPGGGAVVAIIGVDGSGKSTVVAAIRAWLGSEIDTIPIYFGTGDGRPSLLLRPFKMMVPLITRLLRTRPKGSSHGKISNHGPGFLYRMLLTIWSIVVAREKRNKLLAARRGASRGLVVLADRYPQNEIVGFNDGPLLSRLRGVPQWLRRLESSAYALAHRLPPDLVIKLHVTPETAATREPNMDPSVTRERIEAIQHLNFAARRVVSINAERPLTEVIRTTKSEIWRLL